MQITIQMVVNDEGSATTFEDIIKLDKSSDTLSGIGLSLEDSKESIKIQGAD